MDRFGITVAFIISTLATACHGKVLFTEHQQNKLIRFLPVALTGPQHKKEMQELLEKIFKPLLDYQKRQTIYEENITKKKEIVRIRCQLNSKVTGSKEGGQLRSKLKQLLAILREKTLLEKYTPMKFF